MINFDILNTKEKHKAIAKTHTDTEAEATLSELLAANSIPFKAEVIIGKYRVDFLLGTHKILEVNGGYHSKRAQRKKDKARATYLLKKGYEIKEISNDDVFKCKAGKILLNELISSDTRCVSEKFVVPKKRKKRVCAKNALSKHPFYKRVMEAKRKWRKEVYRKKRLEK